MNKKTLSILCFVSMAAACFNPLGKEALAGNFSRSCGDISLDGTTLRANCKDRSANFRSTSLDLNRRIENRDGNLRIGGGFASTCQNIQLTGTSLQADCKTFNGDFRSTSLDLNSVITNNDGNLTFDR
ncbi:CVNH domain-containing protein [Brasilonema bromeliae]|uniref:Cyanovirin-N domain-containing protein n=1 Tax=Brasilonema bromeliae SPC951 TaxID=385972 RepID=A0ABX1P656_9CYAN|nr:CVNH domain-containing protein [Brasilonema bromeliae]NMG19821.1 hypothetical protein [Brasilonema bromeliae SPC951]